MSENTKKNASLQANQSTPKPQEPKMKASSITKIKGKDTATYEGMLDFGHQHGIVKLSVELIQAPSKENNNIAICEANLSTPDGREFSDIGDASPANTPKGCAEHFIRIASTRAKMRVLCDAFNIKSIINSDHGHDESVIDADFSVVERASLPEAQPGNHPNPISSKQISMLKGLASKRTMSDEELENIARHKFNKDINSLSTKEAHLLIKHIG
ncbi:hypothetical protein [Desulfocurvibacter africanus]|uniref:hypothetical protein n=1 Tax=Desulfocurvibacter africanus TaxID=873 RepID=UPI000486CB2C|nr:hypothetical protein [Desulfocurvibacter africanus]